MNLFTLFALSTPAEATVVGQYVCVYMDEHFSQRWPNADYWTSNAVRPMPGIRIRVTDTSTSTVVADTYADGGSNDSCIFADLDDNGYYKVEAITEAEVNGYTITSKRWSNTTGTASEQAEVLDYSFKPASYKTETDFVIDWGLENWSEMLVGIWMASRAGTGGFRSWSGNEIAFLSRSPYAGTPGFPLHYATVIDHCTDGSIPTGSCGVVPAHIHAVLVTEVSDPNKFVIAHETGHWIGGKNDESYDPFTDYSHSFDNCEGAGTPPHNFFQKQYHSLAAVEGFASYIAAVMFNRTDEYDCTIQPYLAGKYDYDLNGLVDSASTNGEFSCEGRAWDINHNGVRDGSEPFVDSSLTARDWLEKAVNNNLGNAADGFCGGTLSKVSNEYDWMRFFWDLRTDESVSLADTVELYDRMNPRSWDDQSGSIFYWPRTRLGLAASAMGISTEVNDQADNGQDH